MGSAARLVTVDRFNAFAVNGVGLDSMPFPLSLSVDHANEFTVLHGAAARAIDLLDVVSTDAHEFAAVLNVDHVSWFR